MENIWKKWIIFIGLGLAVADCGPKTPSQERSTAQSGQGSSNFTNDGTGDGQQDYGDIDLSDIPDTASAKELAKLSSGELKLLLTERNNQDLAEEEQFDLLVAMNRALCERLNSVRLNCPAIARISSSGLDLTLQCDGSIKQESGNKTSIQVTMPTGITSEVYLLVNDAYKSTKFSGGTTTISFQAIPGIDDLAPKFISVFKLTLRPAVEGRSLPPREDITIKIVVDGNELVNSRAYSSEDPILAQKDREYKLDVAQIVSMRESSRCKTTKEGINDLKAQIRTAVEAEQARRRTQDYQRAQEEAAK